MKAVPCSLCGGKPEFVYYAPNRAKSPEVWEYEYEDEFDLSNDKGVLRPIILFKRLQCSQCKATVNHLALSCNDAVNVWNDNQDRLIEYVGTEECFE